MFEHDTNSAMKVLQGIQATFVGFISGPVCQIQGPVLLLRHDAVARILANGSAAFIESCPAIGWNSGDSVRSL